MSTLPSPNPKHVTQLPRVEETKPPNIICNVTQPANNITIQKQVLVQSKPLYPTVNHIYDENSKREILDSLRNSSQKEVWEKVLSNEWGHSA